MTALDCPAAPPETAPDSVRAAALLAALPVGVAVATPDGRVTPVNALARNLLADTPDPGCLAGSSGRVRLTDGTELAIDRGPLADDQGEVLLLRDRTGDQRLDDVLARHQRLAALGELAATLAHQIRTPLTAALLYVGNAQLPGLAADQRGAMLDRASVCLRNLDELVAGMLGFARGAATGGPTTRIADVLAGVAVAVEPACRPGQQVSIDPLAGDPAVSVGREPLTGAILNLVQNALQAAGTGARVRVGVDSDLVTATLRVTDNGPGIPPALRRRVCEPFFTTRPDGTGLGLAVVDALARSAGGRLAIDDAEPHGACFRLTLPLAGSAARPSTESP